MIQLTLPLLATQTPNKKKNLTQRKRILKLLNEHDFVPTAALRTFAYQYNARIHELRKKGWQIISRKDQRGRHGYELVGQTKR